MELFSGRKCLLPLPPLPASYLLLWNWIHLECLRCRNSWGKVCALCHQTHASTRVSVSNEVITASMAVLAIKSYILLVMLPVCWEVFITDFPCRALWPLLESQLFERMFSILHLEPTSCPILPLLLQRSEIGSYLRVRTIFCLPTMSLFDDIFFSLFPNLVFYMFLWIGYIQQIVLHFSALVWHDFRMIFPPIMIMATVHAFSDPFGKRIIVESTHCWKLSLKHWSSQNFRNMNDLILSVCFFLWHPPL